MIAVPLRPDPAAVSAFRAWQDRIRDPSLTVLLVIELCAIFIAVPMAAEGEPIATLVARTLLLAAVAIVVTVSHRWGAVALIVLGFTSSAMGWFLTGARSTTVAALWNGGDIVTLCALIWVVGHAVYAPGRVTRYRLLGAVVIYLSLATIFASAFTLLSELRPHAFTEFDGGASPSKKIALMLYFSFATLTGAGYGDVVPVDPFARSLANLETVVGQFFLATSVARLVTLWLKDLE